MPSKSKKTISKKRTTSTARATTSSVYTAQLHPVFWPMVLIAFVLWVIYRSQLHFPVWFDEIIGKAIFFGLPVWLYMNMSGGDEVFRSLAPAKLRKGLLLGVAIGGLYGFAGAIGSSLVSPTGIQAVPLYSSPAFWWEFFLVGMTALWETLFFFSWIQGVIMEKYHQAGLLAQVLFVTAVFVAFHIPNTLLLYPTVASIGIQVILLTLFALGQALVFSRWQNFYTLAVSHAFWAMVLVVHLR